MIFADKLIALRKKCGWSQEELAEKMNVTRQSVSKWEGAQSVPDLNKILQLSELFGVSTDYLLKDEIEENEYVETVDEEKTVRRVSMEEANEFLSTKCKTAKFTALGTFLCILSIIPLMLFGGLAEFSYGMSENAAGGLGMVIMFTLIAIAVVIFIITESKVSQFDFLEKEVFETEYGVTGMVKERKNQYKDTYTRNNVIGAALCILSLVPLFLGAFVVGENETPENELCLVFMLCVMFFMIATGVVFLSLEEFRGQASRSFCRRATTQRQRKEIPLQARLLLCIGFLLLQYSSVIVFVQMIGEEVGLFGRLQVCFLQRLW